MNKEKGLEAATSKPSDKNIKLKTALEYAKVFKFKVFPLHSIIHEKCTCNNSNCSNKAKHPATRNGVKDATTDENIITKWWTDRPHLNIGIATGKASGFFVLDIDTDVNKKTGLTGFEALDLIENRYGDLPSTVHQITGSGGSHYLFKYIEGIGNKTNLYPSIDIRGDGGYIVVSPSIHEAGNEYSWQLDHSPLDIDIAESPKFLIEAIIPKGSKGKHKPRPASDYVSIFQGVEDGGRNDALMTLIGHLIVRLDYREAFEIVHIWNETRVYPPLERDVVTTAFNNILRREAEKR